MEEPSTPLPQEPSLQLQVNVRPTSLQTPLKHQIRTTGLMERRTFDGTYDPGLIMATLDKELAEAKEQHQSLGERCNQILELMLAFEQYRLCAERENLQLRALNIELSKLFHRRKEMHVNSMRQLSFPASDNCRVASPSRQMDSYLVNEPYIGQADHEIITKPDSIRPLTMPSSPVQAADYIASQLSDLSIDSSKPFETSFEEMAGHAYGGGRNRPCLIYITSPVMHKDLFAGSESRDASHSSWDKMCKSSSDLSEQVDSPLKPSNISTESSALSADYPRASKSSQDLRTPLHSSPPTDLSSTSTFYNKHTPSPEASSKDSNSNHGYGSSNSSSCTPTGPLPKSISIRVKGMALKPKTESRTSSSDSATGRNTRSFLPSPLRPHRLQLESPKSGIKNSSECATMAGEAEYEAYEQGTYKTELCNKGLECPYGSRCQFAHGLEELRPVMRHRLYKTHPCRMFMAGRPCSYGHRCHFRHSLRPADHTSMGTGQPVMLLQDHKIKQT